MPRGFLASFGLEARTELLALAVKIWWPFKGFQFKTVFLFFRSLFSRVDTVFYLNEMFFIQKTQNSDGGYLGQVIFGNATVDFSPYVAIARTFHEGGAMRKWDVVPKWQKRPNFLLVFGKECEKSG